MRILYFAAAVALGFPSSALSQADKCAGIENDLDRLACYDAASGRTPSSKTSKAAGSWNERIVTSEFEDTKDVFLYVDSEAPIDCGSLRGSSEARLFLRCMENTTAVIIQTKCHLTSSRYNGYGDVDVRMDDAPAKVVSMESSTSNDALGLWSGGKAIPFIKSMIGKEKLITRFTPFSESPVTARFDITGLDEAIAPLRESCGW